MGGIDITLPPVYMLNTKHMLPREEYREGEVPHRAHTGGGHILPTCSCPYSHAWLNNHHFRGAPDARLICKIC
ncbi:MAG TPA: hypothetical protein VG098_01760 [Nitrososphaera sp.]|nr:hypothetical protein [Nitrososphaera sp.]